MTGRDVPHPFAEKSYSDLCGKRGTGQEVSSFIFMRGEVLREKVLSDINRQKMITKSAIPICIV
jgi:hypothetical protein